MKALMSIRISQEAKDLLVKLAEHLGVSQTAVLELAIRRLAKQEKLR
jgi:predicted transcriptional regulator